MALATDKSIFLHVPKCAGLFIRHVFKVCNIAHYELGQQHNHFPELLRYKPESFYNNIYSFAFIRHPLTWYQSRWAFRLKSGWKLQHPLDFNCASNDFTAFVENMLRYRPDGWLTNEYKNYIDTVPGGIKFVGRVEYLISDIISILRQAGEQFDERLIRTIPKINDSNMDDKPPKHWAKYTKDLANRVMSTEHEIITRFYNDYHININSLCGPRQY